MTLLTHRTIGISGLHRGFSLIELLLVVSIFVIITSIGLASFSAFNSRTLLTSLAYDIALSIREVQAYSISVRGVGTNFKNRHGLHFDLGHNVYARFAEPITGDKAFTGNVDGCTGECIEVFELRNGYQIVDLCGGPVGSPVCGLTRLTILFERPNPDALINNNDDPNSLFAEGTIVVRSVSGDTRTVRVLKTGQIAISN